MRLAINLLLLALICFLLPLAHVLAADIIVQGDCSLPDAIRAANEDAATSGCSAGSGADTLFLRETYVVGSPLPITSDITIEGGGHTVSGGQGNRIFHVEREGRLTIRHLRVINGGGEPAIMPTVLDWDYKRQLGGAIFSEGMLEIANSEFSRNSGLSGGAIFVGGGKATISSSEFSGNSSRGSGGAIAVYLIPLTITDSRFVENTSHSGGAILARTVSDLTIINNEFYSNSATTSGGAINVSGDGGPILISDSVFSANSANDGGAVVLFSHQM